MTLKFFPETIILIKVDCFEEILNQNKIDGMVNDHTSSCESYNLKKCMQILLNPFAIF